MWLWGWELLTIIHNLSEFGGPTSSVNGDITYLNCYMTSQVHVIEGSCDIVVGDPSGMSPH